MVQERPVRVERRLSAILAADVAGYSRLMHNDEESTHAKLTALLMDAVNPAIAEPGGICISSSAYDQVLGKITVEFVDLGEQQLKNIARPVRVYHVRLNGTSVEATPALPDKPSIAVMSFNNMSGDPERRRRSGGAAGVPRRAVLAGAGSTVALGLG